MGKLLIAGESDLGFQRTQQEDYILVKNLDSETTLAMVVDGNGSTGTKYNPAALVAHDTYRMIHRIFTDHKDLLIANAELFLSEALISAGNTLATLKEANEELYNGYGASVSCCLFYNSTVSFAHTGNTRINMVRRNRKTGDVKINQLSKDQTEGQVLVDKGEISFNEYHLRPERLRITGGLGFSSEPSIQTFTTNLRENDFLILTTDGIHYAIRPDVMVDILRQSDQCQDCVKALIQAAKIMEYNDNMAAVLCWYSSDPQEQGGTV